MANNEEMGSFEAQPSDMISNLPVNIVESILMCLPTRDAVRTSILSRIWRYRWAKVPRLILDEMFWDKATVKHSVMNTVAMILYQIILLHEGPIKKFTLSIPGLEGVPEVDNLIFFLSRNGIEDLTLNMQENQLNRRYRLPLSFFKCQHLRHLSLAFCLIDTPFAFKGFSRLITLKLHRVSITVKVLESLISSCPLLELLDLPCARCSSDLQIKIDAPRLKTFRFCGNIDTLIFKNVPHLSQVTFLPFPSERGTYNLVKFFDDLPVIKKLHVNHRVIKSLATREVPSRLLTNLVCLQDLKFSEIILDELNVLGCILCLIRSSPNLKHVDVEFSTSIVLHSNVCLELVSGQSDSDVMLNQLKDVKMQCVTGTMTELELIKFLLAKSPSLKQMRIQPRRHLADKGLKILKELTKFRRASAEAEVIYVDLEENLG